MLARVPWAPPFAKPQKAKPRKLSDTRRRRLVEAVADIMKAGFEAGAPSKFAFETTCRGGIRSALCIEEWKWQEVDGAAEDVVSRALAMIGATWPTWKEGQPEWTQDGFAPVERARCANCGKGLLGEQLKFCSPGCGTSWRRRTETLQQEREVDAYDTALRETIRWRTCRR